MYVYQFFEKPILNSPYSYPGRHWELDASGQPTQKIKDERRKAKKQKGMGVQASLIPRAFNYDARSTDFDKPSWGLIAVKVINHLGMR